MAISETTPVSESGSERAPAPVRNERVATRRRYLMCRPEYFTVSYRINPWMNPQNPTDTSRALAQWETLRSTFLRLGHEVEVIEQIDGLPDMVYTANGGFTADGVAFGARFTYPERKAEGAVFMTWFEQHGFTVVAPRAINEGEGDFMLVGDTILAGTGFRTSVESHAELARAFDREVVTVRLVNADFYHLDTAISVLDPVTGDAEANIAYLPSAFDEHSRRILRERYPDAVLAGEEDSHVLGLNSISDGKNVVISPRAHGFEAQLRDRGYTPIGVDLSELLLGGGGVKCCTLELRR